MTPVIPHSSSPTSTVPRATFNARKNSSLIRCCVLKSYSKRTSYPQNNILPLSPSDQIYPHIRTGNIHSKVVSASGVDVAVEESDPAVADQDSSESIEGSDVQSEEDSSAQPKHARTSRKSDMPPVKDEELVPGATFTGKVRSIQPFGAFVDFGAFTEGLVHVSQLSDEFVKNVGDIVSVGEEVDVRLLEANTKTGRVSLSMRTSDSSAATTYSDRKGSPRRNSQNSNRRRDGPTNSKFEVRQDIEGTVKNLTKLGAFISLPEGEEGFLPQSEEGDAEIGGIMGSTTLEVGQQVSVRVLRISRGQATLTMKKENRVDDSDKEVPVGTVYAKTSPFLSAFLKNNDIAAYLEVREKEMEKAEALKNAEIAAQNIVGESVLTSDVIEVKSDGGSIIEEVQIEMPIPEAADSSSPPVEIEKAEAESDESNNITGEVQAEELGEENENANKV